MKKYISFKLASTTIITICSLALFMHILILFQIIPYHFVWGGRLNSSTNLYIFETISITVQILFLFVIVVKAGYMFKGQFNRLVNIGIWAMFVLMILNTIGNLASNSFFETIIMTPITAFLALLLFRIGIE
jgi:cation transport ATPase